ncbi:porin, partial [Balneolaceae bacterium ANBcel3]|nr:porin [Balneolaceae bacterium ANBcel3]
MRKTIPCILMALFIMIPVSGSAVAETKLSYKSDDKPVVVQPNRPQITELKIRGRIQGQFAYSDGSNDNAGVDADSYSSFEMRRVRLGVQGKIQGNWNFMVEANVLSTVDLDAATLTYAANPAAMVTFGKAKPRFGLEENTSSASILTIERTRLNAHLNGGKPLG